MQDRMKFGLLYEIDGLHAAPRRSLHDALWEALEQVKLAEELGFHSVWSIDHAVAEPTPAASAPEMWLAAVAQHTTRIRIGHAMRWEPFAYDNPIRVAERAAVLDLMSGGRFELGTGRPPSPAELERLGLDARELRAHWDELLRMLAGMWTQDEFSWASERFEMPPRNVLPRPVQPPHPPLWMSGRDPEEAVFAGERGLGFMLFGGGDPAQLERTRRGYREASARARPAAGGVNDRFAVVAPLDVVAAARDAGRDAARGAEFIDAGEREGVDLMCFVVPTGAAAHDDIRDALRRFRSEWGPRFDG